jgi:hypothetical protein
MARYLIPFLFLLTLFSAERIEIYEDWQPDALGAAFDPRIIAVLEQKGYSARRWDRKAHEPFLLTWKRVKTWVDFKHWLGLGLPRKTRWKRGRPTCFSAT